MTQILTPRDVPLGGLRAMNVRRTLPQRQRSLIGAWCFLDHYGPDRVDETGGMLVAPHPHIGLQTVSWLFGGSIEHRDSVGTHALVRPGALNLMTAGRGISHSEASTDRVTVLRLGRVVGDFSMQDTTQEQIVQAITGASDNVVARRQARTSAEGGANTRREPHKDWTVTDTQERS